MRPALVLVVTAVAAAAAQTIDYTGTYRLDKAASQITAGAGLNGLGPGGTPNTLYLQQAANGSITVGSDMNEGQSRMYRIGGESSLPALKGDPIPVKSRVEGRALISEGAGLHETLSLSDDGTTLTVRITAGEASSTLVYRRMNSVDACEQWPTPCRR